jgi:hypothetical protein
MLAASYAAAEANALESMMALYLISHRGEDGPRAAAAETLRELAGDPDARIAEIAEWLTARPFTEDLERSLAPSR